MAPPGRRIAGESFRILGPRPKAPQGTRILRSKVYCVILHKKYTPPWRVCTFYEVCLRRHPERATQKIKENNMSEKPIRTLNENSYITSYITTPRVYIKPYITSQRVAIIKNLGTAEVFRARDSAPLIPIPQMTRSSHQEY
jgi:hypothetical protein